MSARTKNIASLAGELAESDEIKEAVEQQIQSSRLINTLISMRMDAQLSQAALAKHMKCSQGKVSKMEGGTDETLKLYDVVEYVGALDHGIQLNIHPNNMPKSEKIKHHVFMIHDLLNDLAKLAKDDDVNGEIAKKIDTFFGEVLMNFMRGFAENHQTVQSCLTVSLGGAVEGITEETKSLV
ncbi:MAG: hypothetical protein V5783_01025 [Pontiella sp.]